MVGSWLLVPVIFTQTYATEYFATKPHGGLRFPEGSVDFNPHYGDFLYFSFAIAVAFNIAASMF